MSITIGIGLAFVAMLSWGVGDFWMQRSIRKVGNFETLFFIAAFGALVTFPFVYKNLPIFFASSWQTFAVVFGLCLILLFASIIDFEALRIGKLSVVEPVWSFEVPVSAILAFFILSEQIQWFQIVLIASLLVGLGLVSVSKRLRIKDLLFERGVFVALLGATLMGTANFFMGWGSRVTDPLMANFLVNIFITFCVVLVLLAKGTFRNLKKALKSNSAVLLQTSISDNVAWIAFAFAMSLAPIAIVTALSESYIIVAVLLGVFINKEKLARHQKFGLVLALFSALVLAGSTV
ncbi:MAG: EamA family transporter [Patescibacteria group bacterium]